MLILTLRTDKPEAEIGLYQDDKALAYHTWLAHRELAETLHTKLRDLLKSQERGLADIEGIVVFEGPGSFTGLRIGLSVANSLSGSLNKPIVGARGDGWLSSGIQLLKTGHDQGTAMPYYGSEAKTTQQRK